MKGPGRIGIEAQLEVLLPVQGGTRLGQFVVPVARARDAQGHVGGVGRDPVGHAALLDVVLLGQAQVLLGRHVAEHRRAVIRRRGRADAGGDVVVAGEDVRDQRPEHVERRAVAETPLQLHVELDLVEGHVARPLDHHLDAVGPGPLGQLPDSLKLGKLRIVGGVGKAARAQTVADRERHVVPATYLADLVPQFVHGVLAVVVEHPLGEQRPAAGDDADEPVPDEREVLAQNARMNREVVDALGGLLLQLGEDNLVREVVEVPTDDHRVDRHRADRDRRLPDNRFAALVEVAACGEIHDRVGPPPFGPAQLLQLLARTGRDRRRAHVGVDLGLRRPTDAHRVEPVPQVHAVGGDNEPSRGNLVADLFGGEVLFALGNAGHLGRDDAAASVLELGHRLMRPLGWKKVPRGLVRRIGHPRRVRRRVHERTTHVGGPGETSGGGSLA